MSQARITLRPPPNVEFVQGYPGIPAGNDRPHAEVKGSIELRMPASGIKAKWVRVELRKVETLPGGGQSNTFYDFVGQSPLKVWEAPDGEYGVLVTNDFPFAIRIPESIPPTIALDKGAGIKYELNATVCIKGKKSFFFRRADSLQTTTQPIIIDKHELHSTWPVYAQPENRHVVEELLSLTVDRTNTCFGPGDRARVVATFKNDGIPAASLRAFEFLLKETIIFRAGPQASGKKGAPQVQVTPIGEQKLSINMTVYQGQQYRADLGCFIPQTHTTTTVGAARHMDISYSINVKAVLATGKPLLMELPVTISNWPRNISMEAIRRIGHAPNLSLANPVGQPIVPNTIGATRTNPPQTVQQPGFNTAPSRTAPFQMHNAQNSTAHSETYHGDNSGMRRSYDEFGTNAGQNSSVNEIDSFRRPSLSQHTGRRLTLVNSEEPESPPSAGPPPQQQSPPKKFLSAFEEKKLLQESYGREAGGSGSGPTQASSIPAQSTARTTSPQSQRTAWPSAEEEKQKLYNMARQRAEQTQATMGISMPSMPGGMETADSLRSVSPPVSMSIPEPAPIPSPTRNTIPKKNAAWPSAEEEKMRLFNDAQSAVRRVQGQAGFSGVSSFNEGSGSPPATRTQFGDGSTYTSSSYTHDTVQYPPRQADPVTPPSTGARLYQDAMANMPRNSITQPSAGSASSPPRPGGSSALPSSSGRAFPTAEEEKFALRYYEAKRAVDRHQNADAEEGGASSSAPNDAPIAYDELFPAGSSPPRSGPVNTNGIHGIQNNNYMSLPLSSPPPHIPQAPIDSALSEKERLRRKYEAEDAAASAAAVAPPSPPPRASGSGSRPELPSYGAPPSDRFPPPPPDIQGRRVLTAAEEKARLRAQMEAEDAAAATRNNGPGSSSMNGVASPPPPPPSASYTPQRATSLSYSIRSFRGPPDEPLPPLPPPPLAPRPPAEYIQQTREEDARSQAEHSLMIPNPQGEEPRVNFGLSFRPFSPFDLGVNFNNGSARNTPAPRPPLPPKVPLSMN